MILDLSMKDYLIDGLMILFKFLVRKKIYQEIRCWVVNKKVITASNYRIGNEVIYKRVIDEVPLNYAQSMVDKFQLNDAFVIDICETENGWKMVECGCINCAGFYDADLQKLLVAIEDHFQID